MWPVLLHETVRELLRADVAADVERRGDLIQADVEVIGDHVPLVRDGAGLDLGDPSVRVLADVSHGHACLSFRAPGERRVQNIGHSVTYTPEQY
jgi:hypothetical protein